MSRTRKFHYVTQRQCRYGYRFLEEWQKRWHRGERRHWCDKDGFPIDEHVRRTISVGSSNTLEALIYKGLGGKVGDSSRKTVIKADLTELDPLADPLKWVRLSSKRKRILRLCSTKLADLTADAA